MKVIKCQSKNQLAGSDYIFLNKTNTAKTRYDVLGNEGNSGEDSMMFDKKPLSVGLMDLLLSSLYEAKQIGHETSFAGLIS